MVDRRLRPRKRHDQRHAQATPTRPAYVAREQQEKAAERRRQHLRGRRRSRIAYVLFGLAVLVAGSHIVEHLGVFQLLSPGWQDLLIGYPTAGILAVAGGMLPPGRAYVGRCDRPTDRRPHWC